MLCGEQGAALGDLIEADKKNVDDEGNQQQGHRLREAFSEHFLNTRGNGVLTVIGVNDAGRQVETVLKTCKNRTEIAGQSAGTDVQDQHTDDGLQSTGQGVIPLLSHQAVAQKGKETYHIRSLLQDIGRKEGPDCIENI